MIIGSLIAEGWETAHGLREGIGRVSALSAPEPSPMRLFEDRGTTYHGHKSRLMKWLRLLQKPIIVLHFKRYLTLWSLSEPGTSVRKARNAYVSALSPY